MPRCTGPSNCWNNAAKKWTDNKCGNCCDNPQCGKHTKKAIARAQSKKRPREPDCAEKHGGSAEGATCHFCQGGHTSSDCPTLPAEEPKAKRRKLTKKQKKRLKNRAKAAKRKLALRLLKAEKARAQSSEDSDEESIVLEECAQCHEEEWEEEIVECITCDDSLCERCARKCDLCKEPVCQGCLHTCELIDAAWFRDTTRSWFGPYGLLAPPVCHKEVCKDCTATRKTLCCEQDVTGCSFCIEPETEYPKFPIGMRLVQRCCDPFRHGCGY